VDEEPLAIAKLEDRRALIDRTESQSLGYVMQQNSRGSGSPIRVASTYRWRI